MTKTLEINGLNTKLIKLDEKLDFLSSEIERERKEQQKRSELLVKFHKDRERLVDLINNYEEYVSLGVFANE